MNKSEIKYISLIAPLIYLYFNIFLWSKNVSMFSKTELSYSFIAIITLSILYYVISYFIFSLFYLKIQNDKVLKLGIGFFIGIFIGVICNFLFFRTLFFPYHHIVMYASVLGIVLIVYFNIAQYFVKFSCVLLIIAFCSFGYNSYKNFSVLIDDTDKYLVEFKDKPNIYMVWLESFHGARTLKDVYHVDVSPLTKFLEENEFIVFENVYSSGPTTLSSLTSLFSLGAVNFNDFTAGKDDAKTAIRKLIAGGPGNNVLKILKYNGYVTNVSIGGSYYFTFKENYLDYAPIDLYSNNYFYPCYAFSKFSNSILLQFPRFNFSQFPRFKLDVPIKNFLESEIDKMQRLKQPYFLSIKYDEAFHVSWDSYSDKRRTELIESGKYQKQIERGISDIPMLISVILKKDPNAVIVIYGDHGVHTYAGINNLRDMQEIIYHYMI